MLEHNSDRNYDDTLAPGIYKSWIIQGLASANERWRYVIKSSLIGRAHTQNDPCNCGAIIYNDGNISTLEVMIAYVQGFQKFAISILAGVQHLMVQDHQRMEW